MDPITLFLALAFADNAFEGDLTLEQVMEMKKAQISTARWFKFKQSKLNGPVFRQCTKNGMTQNGKGMTYDTLLKEYDDLLFRAGFLVQVTLYGLRRNMGNVLDGVYFQESGEQDNNIEPQARSLSQSAVESWVT